MAYLFDGSAFPDQEEINNAEITINMIPGQKGHWSDMNCLQRRERTHKEVQWNLSNPDTHRNCKLHIV